MVNKNFYIGALVIITIFLAAVFATESERIDWRQILYSQRKIPYGTYAFREYFESLRKENTVNRHRIIDVADSIPNEEGLLVLTNYFSPTEQDVNSMLDFVSKGGVLGVHAADMDRIFLDTLGLDIYYTFTNREVKEYQEEFIYSVRKFFTRDTTHITFRNKWIVDDSDYVIRKNDLYTYLKVEKDSVKAHAQKVAVDGNGNTVALRLQVGKGSLLISTVPYMFSNIYFLFGENHEFVRYMLSYFGNRRVHWTEFYAVGSGEAQTPFRYLLSEDALRYAWYLTLILLLLFFLFHARRTQRAIPVLEPPENRTLQFVRTIGNLYLENGSHQQIAMKRIHFFFDYLRSHLYINRLVADKELAGVLTRKTRIEEPDAQKLIRTIRHVQDARAISPETLRDLSGQLDHFYNINEQ